MIPPNADEMVKMREKIEAASEMHWRAPGIEAVAFGVVVRKEALLGWVDRIAEHERKNAEMSHEALGAAQWLEQVASRFEKDWPSTAGQCRRHAEALLANLNPEDSAPSSTGEKPCSYCGRKIKHAIGCTKPPRGKDA